MRCKLCGNKINHQWWDDFNYCPRCGLYQMPLDNNEKKIVVDTINNLLNKRKEITIKFNYYETLSGGYIRFIYRDTYKLIDEVCFHGDTTLDEIDALIKILSELSIVERKNITSAALTLFRFTSCHIGNIYDYWMKRGLKEKNWHAYDDALYALWAKEDKSKRNQRKIRRYERIMRHIPDCE